MAVTKPVFASTVATLASELLHTPPLVVVANVEDEAGHKAFTPVIGATAGVFTVNGFEIVEVQVVRASVIV